MMSTEYATTISSLTVKPVCDKTILGESTTVRIDDIGSGMFVRVEQDQGRIVIDQESWPHIMEAIDRMISICSGVKFSISEQDAR